ncbi:MAG: SoxR reducing system RseC family protein [Gammaproteobacteria bacterium]|nr:SoxR reducing system RseC family protein [Gammaproteobacteria bacterium]NND38800.1 SoxR reducing system RseC family protein [Pseudomonadales bacterium]NNL11375.1 SoxR reducing system RseC family protein [Pseudomonadales bacterium]NNM11821.1 SoxR reducing system RseC family protein [Pseudomonadales bacterium]
MVLSSLTPPEGTDPGNHQAGHSVERARVVSVQRGHAQQPTTVWVEAFQQTTCGSCSAKHACGQGVLQRWFARRQRHYPVRCDAEQAGLLAVGQWVEVAVPEGALSRASVLAYLVPLFGMLSAAILAEFLALADLAVAACAALGLGGGMLLARRLALPSERSALEPRLLRLAHA